MLYVPIQLPQGLHGQRSAYVKLHISAAAARRSTSCPPRHTRLKLSQQPQPTQLLHSMVACAAVQSEEVSYEWSWRQSRSSLPEHSSAFDSGHPVPDQLGSKELLASLSAAAAAADTEDLQQQPSQAWMSQWAQQTAPLVLQLQAAEVCQALQNLSQLDWAPDEQWMAAAMQNLCLQVTQLSTNQLSGVLWALSNLRHTPEQQHWEALLQSGAAKLQDFYGPDLAQFVCAVGSMHANSNSSFDLETGARLDMPAAEGSSDAAVAAAAAAPPRLSLPAGWDKAVADEVEYQVVEFVGDLGAYDLARLASGLADLGITPSSKLQDALLKAVYMRTRTIEEKGAVDFALAKLDAKGKKSMHYDPRWTHEELKWLPRRERDKRRILKEGWYRTQWTGFRPGQ